MKRVKLPSGRIIDIDAISSIRPPASYNTGRSCAFIVDGHSTEVCNGDADALYTAVLATVEPIRLTDSDEHSNVEGRYNDLLRISEHLEAEADSANAYYHLDEARAALARILEAKS